MPRVIKVQRLSFTSIYNEISLTLHTLYYINISLTAVVWKWTLSLTHIVNTKTSLLVCASRAGFSFHFKDSMDLQALYAENNTISFRFQQSETKLLFTMFAVLIIGRTCYHNDYCSWPGCKEAIWIWVFVLSMYCYHTGCSEITIKYVRDQQTQLKSIGSKYLY